MSSQPTDLEYRNPGAAATESGPAADIKHNVKAADRALTDLYAMMDPCHLLWRASI